MNLEDVLLRGTRAAQPSFLNVSIGALYCVTDEGDIIEQSTGAAWVAYSPTSGTGDVSGPASSTDEAVARFNGTTGKVLQNSVVLVNDTGTITFPTNVRQTFVPGTVNAGLNVGSTTSDPSSPSNGDIYYDSSNSRFRARINGTWVTLARISSRNIEYVIDGGGAVITTGIKGDVEVGFACTITSARIFADTTCNITINVWKDTYANFPPTSGDSIVATATPSIVGAVKTENTVLAGWTTSISAGDTLRFNVDTVATATRALISLTVLPST